MEMMEALINRSSSCVQKLGYDCKRSRLLNTPVGDSDNFSPYGYWVSRQNRMMDYWAGSLPGMYERVEKFMMQSCADSVVKVLEKLFTNEFSKFCETLCFRDMLRLEYIGLTNWGN